MADLRSPANPGGRYDVRALREMVVAARQQGASDAELLAELQSHPFLGPRVAQLQQGGMSPKQALDSVAVILPEEKYDPTEGMGEGQKFAAGVGMSIDKAIRGGKQVIGGMLPFVSKETKDRWAKDNQAADARDLPLRNTGMGAVGEFTGDVLTTAVPGVGAAGAAMKFLPQVAKGAGVFNLGARAGRAGAVGAAGGIGTHAVTPETETLSSFGDYAGKAGRGAVEGVAGDVAGRALGRVIKPARFNVDPEHRARLDRLRAAGIGNATPGNQGYGAFDLAQLTDDRTLHDLRASLSKLPSFSSDAEQRVGAQLGDFTQSVTARTGTPSRSVSPAALQDMQTQLDLRGDAFRKMGDVPLDQKFVAELLQAKRDHSFAGSATGADMSVIERNRQLAKGGRTSVTMDQALDTRSALSSAAHGAYKEGKVPGEINEAVQNAYDNAIRRSMDTQSPGAGDAWDTLRRNQGAFLDISRAAGSPGGRTGAGDFLLPKALSASTRSSVGKGNFAQAQSGSLASIADDASRVVSDPIPNSGTTQRSLYSLLLLGGLKGLTDAQVPGATNPITGAMKNIATMGAGPVVAHHALYGKGLFGKKHLANGLFGERESNEALRQLQEKYPAYFTALMESERMRSDAEDRQ